MDEVLFILLNSAKASKIRKMVFLESTLEVPPPPSLHWPLALHVVSENVVLSQAQGAS